MSKNWFYHDYLYSDLLTHSVICRLCSKNFSIPTDYSEGGSAKLNMDKEIWEHFRDTHSEVLP